MLDTKIIFHVEESKWISPMMVHPKKMGDIIICVNMCSLNVACVHDPFPTPFNNKFMENVGGREDYSFTDGFSRYHQVQIAKEDQGKENFVME
jgi:hypothetical protein